MARFLRLHWRSNLNRENMNGFGDLSALSGSAEQFQQVLVKEVDVYDCHHSLSIGIEQNMVQHSKGSKT